MMLALIKRMGRRVEETPRRLLAPVVFRLFPLAHHVGDALDVEDTMAVHGHDRLVRPAVQERRRLIPLDLPALLGTGFLERLDNARDDAGKITLGIRRVAALDDVIAAEGEVVADEDTAAEADPARELLVVAVSQSHHVGVIAIGALQHQDAEVAHPVRGDRMVLFGDLMAEIAERIANHVHHVMMGDRHVRLRRLGGFEILESSIRDGLPARVQAEGHGTSPM